MAEKETKAEVKTDAPTVVYQINFYNNSATPGNFMIFQQDPGIDPSNLSILAWVTKFVNPNTHGFFSWVPTYDFAWMERAALTPELNMGSFQCIPAGPGLLTKNSITLTYNGGYNFIDQIDQGAAGTLNIIMDTTIPVNQVGVGIGMAGSPTFLVPAQPNTNFSFTPKTEYWLAFGNFSKGDLLDTKGIISPVQIVFPEGITKMNATLNPDNTWTVLPA